MGDDTIRYLIFYYRRWRYRPSVSMAAHGFKFRTLSKGIVINGKNYPSAEDRAIALKLNEEWDQVRSGKVAAAKPKHDPGTVGSAYLRALASRRAVRVKDDIKWTYEHESRDDWPRAWRWIEPFFADVDPKTITPEMFLDVDPKTGKAVGLIPHIERKGSISERHRAIKI